MSSMSRNHSLAVLLFWYLKTLMLSKDLKPISGNNGFPLVKKPDSGTLVKIII